MLSLRIVSRLWRTDRRKAQTACSPGGSWRVCSLKCSIRQSRQTRHTVSLQVILSASFRLLPMKRWTCLTEARSKLCPLRQLLPLREGLGSSLRVQRMPRVLLSQSLWLLKPLRLGKKAHRRRVQGRGARGTLMLVWRKLLESRSGSRASGNASSRRTRFLPKPRFDGSAEWDSNTLPTELQMRHLPSLLPGARKDHSAPDHLHRSEF